MPRIAPVFVINVPTKIWRPKMVNKYKPPDYNNDIDEGIFEFAEEGRCVYRPLITPWTDSIRDDIILFDQNKHSKELEKIIRIGQLASEETRGNIINMVKKHWDAFCIEGCRRSIIRYQFAIDTGTSTPVCKYSTNLINHCVVASTDAVNAMVHTLQIILFKSYNSYHTFHTKQFISYISNHTYSLTYIIQTYHTQCFMSSYKHKHTHHTLVECINIIMEHTLRL